MVSEDGRWTVEGILLDRGSGTGIRTRPLAGMPAKSGDSPRAPVRRPRSGRLLRDAERESARLGPHKKTVGRGPDIPVELHR